MSTIYIEPFSGASGDMFLGALASLADNASRRARMGVAAREVALARFDERDSVVRSIYTGTDCTRINYLR